ncbi:hypothetical protein ACU4GH_19040 [Bradyrhizobium betae]
MAKLSRSPENRKRIDRLTELVGNFSKGQQQIEAIRRQELALEERRTARSAAQFAKLVDEVARIRKGRLAANQRRDYPS